MRGGRHATNEGVEKCSEGGEGLSKYEGRGVEVGILKGFQVDGYVDFIKINIVCSLGRDGVEVSGRGAVRGVLRGGGVGVHYYQ